MKKSMIAWVLIISIMLLQGSAFAKYDSVTISSSTTESVLKTPIFNSIMNQANINEEGLITIIEEDMETLSKCGVPIAYLTDIDIKNENLIYNLDIPGVTETALVEVHKDGLGEIEIDITEGDCHDIIVFQSNGKIILNGSEVTVSINESYESVANRNHSRARYSEYSSYPFISGLYNSYIGTTNYVLDTGNSFLKDLTVTGISTLIGYVVGGIPGSVASGLFSLIAGQIKSAAERYCPTSTAGSCKIKKYENTNHSNPLDEHYQYVGDYYANSDYSVYVGESIYYQHNYYS